MGWQPRGRLRPALGPLGVAGMDVDRDTVVTTQSLGEAGRDRVAVRQDEALDVIERAPHGAQFAHQVVPVAGSPASMTVIPSAVSTR